MQPQRSGYLVPRWEERCGAFAFSLSGCISAVVLFLFFCNPPTTPFFLLCVLIPLRSQCVVTGVSLWGLMAALWGLLVMDMFYKSRGWLITAEAPGHPGHPPSTQLDAGVIKLRNNFDILWKLIKFYVFRLQLCCAKLFLILTNYFRTNALPVHLTLLQINFHYSSVCWCRSIKCSSLKLNSLQFTPIAIIRFTFCSIKPIQP